MGDTSMKFGPGYDTGHPIPPLNSFSLLPVHMNPKRVKLITKSDCEMCNVAEGKT